MQKQSDNSPSLSPPSLDWRDGTPVSRLYDDVYYSRADGLDEARHVFLASSDLAQRWQHPQQDAAHFIIIESGFGTGLNFLACWQLWQQLWQQQRQPGQSLHYVSIEKHPLSVADIARSAHHWPELAPLCERLCSVYPLPLPGVHATQVDEHVQLTLGFGEIIDVLDQLCDCDHPAQISATAVKADAWFLDGFAPARNPDMWSDAVFERVAQLSKPGTSFATFTAAGRVKRALLGVGFEVDKVAGYGRKRDMLRGQLPLDASAGSVASACSVASECNVDSAGSEQPPPTTARHRAHHGLAWHTAPQHPMPRDQRQAVVIGAGLAGCHTARALAESGWQVTVTERAGDCAAAASGNPAGLLYTRLSADHSDQAEFYLASYLQACRFYQHYFTRGTLVTGRDGELAGLLQLSFSARERRHHDALVARFGSHPDLLRAVSAAEASTLSGIPIAYPALLFAGGGWLRPGEVCRQLLEHPAITVRTNTTIEQLERVDDRWRLHCATGDTLHSRTCIVCSGTDSQRFSQLGWLPTRAVGGQVTLLSARQVDGAATPQLPICHQGYVTALPDGSVCCGASFRVNDAGDDLRQHDHLANLRQLAEHVPALLSPAQAEHLGSSALDGRASVRCTSPDYLPIVGRVPDSATLRTRFAKLARDAKADVADSGAMVDGLWVNTGHGSRGLSTTPIAAALIAAQLNGTPRPLPWPLVRALSPARFIIRTLIKSPRHRTQGTQQGTQR